MKKLVCVSVNELQNPIQTAVILFELIPGTQHLISGSISTEPLDSILSVLIHI
jgi:hypothetical protein